MTRPGKMRRGMKSHKKGSEVASKPGKSKRSVVPMKKKHNNTASEDIAQKAGIPTFYALSSLASFHWNNHSF